jgi:hypothetical protein
MIARFLFDFARYLAAAALGVLLLGWSLLDVGP